ncbi:hypothetical protein AAG570_008880 [Ranatra chinensis]|uniref:39S ribosomal protein L30, mitochondrial n=1 Tax=Ranatra chinensis TaxID=642074 RepID=A0ABD0ZDC3_9HEMI
MSFRVLNRNNIYYNLCSVNYVFKHGLKSWTGGIKYDGFKYFPRFPEEKDPEYEPSKLLMIQRVKPFKGNEYWLKKILVDLRLDGKTGEIAIVKNIPEMIAKLYKIKHLIQITPIRTPNGLPDGNDLRAGYLKENGEFIVTKRVQPDEVRLRATHEFQTDPARLDSETLIKQSREKWNNPW